MPEKGIAEINTQGEVYLSLYSFHIVQTYDELSALKEQWDDLLDHAVFDSFFCCHDWICCWWQCFSRPDDKMAVVTVRKEDKFIAIAPLMIRKHKEYGFRLRVLRFIGVPNADRCDVIIAAGEESVIPELADYLLKNVRDWDQLHLNEVPEESLFANWLKENRSLVYIEPASECPYVPLAQWETWDEYYKSLSRKTRLELNRKNNALRKEGKSRYLHQANPGHDDPSLATARELERKSAKAEHIPTENLALVGEKQWGFQQMLLNSCDTFQVLLSWLEREGEIVAYLYGYMYKKKYYAYNTAFAADAIKYYPGKLIINEVLRYCSEKDIEKFDLLRGATHLKSRWAKESRKQNNLYWLQNKPINWLYAAAVFTIRPLMKRYLKPLLKKK